MGLRDQLDVEVTPKKSLLTEDEMNDTSGDFNDGIDVITEMEPEDIRKLKPGSQVQWTSEISGNTYRFKMPSAPYFYQHAPEKLKNMLISGDGSKTITIPIFDLIPLARGLITPKPPFDEMNPKEAGELLSAFQPLVSWLA